MATFFLNCIGVLKIFLPGVFEMLLTTLSLHAHAHVYSSAKLVFIFENIYLWGFLALGNELNNFYFPAKLWPAFYISNTAFNGDGVVSLCPPLQCYQTKPSAGAPIATRTAPRQDW